VIKTQCLDFQKTEIYVYSSCFIVVPYALFARRVGGSLPVVFSYLSEFFTEKQRGPIVIFFAMCWQPGIIFTGACLYMSTFACSPIPRHYYSAYAVCTCSSSPALLALVMMGLPEYNAAIDFYIGTLHFVNWRLFLIICTIPAFLCSVFFAILPETPAFLYLVGIAVGSTCA